VADLFELTELASYMQRDLDTSTATNARRIASGWLGSATGISEWSAPIPDDLWTWALELAEMAYGNPSGAASESIDDYATTFDRARRASILGAARRKYSVAGTPVYSFPEPDWSWTTVTTTALAD
jgi:hypothetical protein